jgi:hypothetical protein
MDSSSTIQLVFDSDAWDSTISFEPGIPVALSGTLQLRFDEEVNAVAQLGRTFDIFDWTGVVPSGAVSVLSPYSWNLSNLYSTGEVILIAVPEPATLMLIVLGLPLLFIRRFSSFRQCANL